MIQPHDSYQGQQGSEPTVRFRKGEKNWQFIYTTLGFFLTISGTFVSMLGLGAWWKVGIFAAVVLIALYLFLAVRRFQMALLKAQAHFERKFS